MLLRAPASTLIRGRPIVALSQVRCFSAQSQTAVQEEGQPPAGPTRKEKKAASLNFTPEKPMNIFDAIDTLKSLVWSRFDETVELVVKLGVDPRKPNQAIKGICSLPNGNGKKVRVAVFANGVDVETALAAGADIAGGDDLIRQVQEGNINFDRAIATPDIMPQLGKIGKILGPKGLMPNPKLGTVTKDVVKAVKTAKAGSVQFKVEKCGIIHCGVGKISFRTEDLVENIRSILLAIGDAKPEGYKSKYFISAHLSSTMGPGIAIDKQNVDPASPKFLLHPSQLT